MTNLQRWLMYAGIFLIPYSAIITGTFQAEAVNKWMLQIRLLPIILILLFGVYAAGTVLYRTFTFNDCPSAAAELKKQIEEARHDLTAKGFQFKN